MSAPVRLEQRFWTDPRLDVLVELAGYFNRFEAEGRMARLFSACTTRGAEVLSEVWVRGCLGPRGADALVGAELGERAPGGIRVCGANEDQTGWYVEAVEERKASASAGGKARARTAPRDARGRLVAAGQALDEHAPEAVAEKPSEGQSSSRPPATHQPATSDSPAAVQPPSSPLQPLVLVLREEREEARADCPSPSASSSPAAIDRTPGDHAGARVGGGAGPPRDVFRDAADELWHEQEGAKAELRAAGVDPRSRGLGMLHPAKGELVRRLAEQAGEGRGLEVAAADCRHVLAVLLAEAKVSRCLRWIDGGHWEPKRFAQLLSQSPAVAAQRARERRAAGAPGSTPPPQPRANSDPPKPDISPEAKAVAAKMAAEAKRLLFGGVAEEEPPPPTDEDVADMRRHFGVSTPAAAETG